MLEEIGRDSGKLSAKEQGDRLAAAWGLRGYRSQAAFKRALQKEKRIPPDRIKSVARGTGELEPYHVEVLARFLRVPEWWFTASEEDLWAREPETVAAPAPLSPEQLDQLKEALVLELSTALTQTLRDIAAAPPSNETEAEDG